MSISDFFFSPAQISVQPGTRFTWVNQGNAPHTVTADDGSFGSETLRSGQSFSHTFRSPGTVGYHCEIHPSMRFGTGPEPNGMDAQFAVWAMLHSGRVDFSMLSGAIVLLIVGAGRWSFDALFARHIIRMQRQGGHEAEG